MNFLQVEKLLEGKVSYKLKNFLEKKISFGNVTEMQICILLRVRTYQYSRKQMSLFHYTAKVISSTRYNQP